jgi:hypothetical protein
LLRDNISTKTNALNERYGSELAPCRCWAFEDGVDKGVNIYSEDSKFFRMLNTVARS